MWVGGLRLFQFHMAPPIRLMVHAALLEVALGGLLGVALAPLQRLRGGRSIHLLALALAWAGLELYAAPPSLKVRLLALTSPVAGLLLVAGARGILPHRRGLAVALGVIALIGSVATPEIWMRLAAPARPPAPPSAEPPPGAPDVVLVVLDTVRADHVSAYGYPRPTTPHFDALALQGALFLHATAPATWSLPAHASLFTGLFPSGHGAHLEHRLLDSPAPTLAERLQAAGYDTRSFTANAWISDALGLTRGFAWSDEAWRDGAVARGFLFIYRLIDRLGFGAADKGGADVVSHFEEWLETRPSDAPPAFAFLNFIEAHFPYHQVPEGYLQRFASHPTGELRKLSLRLIADQFGDATIDPEEARVPATDMYDAGVLYADHLLGRVVEALRAQGSLDQTVLIVLADHGELLGEHEAFGHGRSLCQPEIHVPLAVRYPPRVPSGVRVAIPVSTVGVYATALDLVGLEPRSPLHVGSLTSALAGVRPEGPVLSERFTVLNNGLLGSRSVDPLLRNDRRYRAYRAGAKKLIKTSQGESFLFDLSVDRAETRDLAPTQGATVERLTDELHSWREALALPALDVPLHPAEAPALDAAARERLRALGYVE
jgi:arylsulfatase A-like enzyme